MKTTIAVLFAISLVACNMNYDKTPSGLTYKIFHEGSGGDKPKAGEFVKFNLEYRLADRDSVLQTTYNSIPAYSNLDTGKKVEYSFWEIVPQMSVGDSAVVSMSIDSLKSRNLIPDYSPLFVKGQVLSVKLKLLKIFKDEKGMIADYDSAIELEKGKELKSLEGYMAKNNLKGIKSKNGVYVVIDNAGDTSMKADSGKIATLKYRGYLETTGKVFDTNMDSTKGHTDPIQIAVGSRSAIQGFSEGLPYFGKGGKGKLLIPAMLGYGPQPSGPDLPAFSNLIFDIEVLDVQNPPKGAGNPMMPPKDGGND
jgi:FKBP-type peptidyl-prolyl cis-trans isomerase FkpA